MKTTNNILTKTIAWLTVFSLVLGWFYTPLPTIIRDRLPGPIKQLAQAPAIYDALATTNAYTTAGPTSWTCPANVYTAYVSCWGAGGGGGEGPNNNAGGGGGGGAYASSTISVTPGTIYSIYVGIGGPAATVNNTDGTSGENSTFATTTLVAEGGKFGYAANTGGAGGNTTVSVGQVERAGGTGGAGQNTNDAAGGGGGAGGPAGAGNGGSAGNVSLSVLICL